MSMLNQPVNGLSVSYNNTNGSVDAVYRLNGVNTVWDYWERVYYPQVIRESYPVYLQERSMDKGQKAFEVIKTLQDKKMLKLDKVSDFIDAMDTLIKVL